MRIYLLGFATTVLTAFAISTGCSGSKSDVNPNSPRPSASGVADEAPSVRTNEEIDGGAADDLFDDGVDEEAIETVETVDDEFDAKFSLDATESFDVDVLEGEDLFKVDDARKNDSWESRGLPREPDVLKRVDLEPNKDAAENFDVAKDDDFFEGVDFDEERELKNSNKKNEDSSGSVDDEEESSEKETGRLAVGEKMRVEGLWLDGSEIDWADYRGKVVLVDFWATWCGPCRGEIPNVKEAFEKYRDAGFEVVGYSLDDDLDALIAFEEDEKLPWKTASRKMSVEAKKRFVDLAEYYSVYGIPTMVLVDKNGVILDTDARGERLQELLRDLFPNVR